MTLNALAPPVADLGALLDDPLEQRRFTRRLADGVAESSLQLSGMHCAACADVIEAALTAVDGVLDARVSAAGARARVRWDPTRTQASRLVAAVRAAGYDAAPDDSAPARALRQQESRRALWRLFVAGLCMMQVMMLATPSYVAGPGELAPDLKQLLDWGAWVLSLPVLLFSADAFFAGAWRALRARRIGMDVPVALGLAVTFVASSGAAFDPGGPFGDEVFFDSLTMFVTFLLAGRWLEMRTRHRAAEQLERSAASLPATAWRLDADGRAEAVSVQRLRPGDRVRVPLGEAFPADGPLLGGSTAADESLLSGESHAQPKAVGDELVAGSINVGAPVVMRVARVGPDTRQQAIVALVRDAMSQRPALAAAADRWATPFLWAVLTLAVGGAAVWSLVDPSRATWVAVSVLIVTCPCALSLAAPSAMLAAAGRLARRGVLLRRLDALQPMAGVRRIFLDKTGTLTDGSLRLRSAGVDGHLLATASSLAAWSAHPLSRAVAAQAAAAPIDWHDVRELPGQGVAARDPAGVEWRLGSAAWTGAEGQANTDGAGAQAWLSREGQPVACLRFDESLRDDADAALAALRAMDVEVELLSGDRSARVQRLAARMGVDAAAGDARPDDKLAAVRAAQARGETVAMVGDGVNDAPVLAQADASFAMGQGALLARANADAVVLSMKLGDVAEALALARRTMRVVRQNILWAAGYNAACIPLALAGWLPPWAAGLGMAASSLVVVLNAMRLAR
jgi:Cu2+-exporting ATPase